MSISPDTERELDGVEDEGEAVDDGEHDEPEDAKEEIFDGVADDASR